MDTAPSYGGGDSERLIGTVLNEAGSPSRRDGVTLVSKFGFYLSDGGGASAWPRSALVSSGANTGPAGVAAGERGLRHCLQPDFMMAELEGAYTRRGWRCGGPAGWV